MMRMSRYETHRQILAALHEEFHMTQQNNPGSPDQQNNQPKQTPGAVPGSTPNKQDDKTPASPATPIKT